MADLVLYQDGVERGRVVVIVEDQPTVEVAPGESINAAITSLGAQGGRVLLRGGSYSQIVRSNDAARTGYVDVESYPGETAIVAGIDLSNVARLRFRRLRVTDNTNLANGCRFVELVDNEHRARIKCQKSGTASCTDITIRGCWIHDFSHTGEAGSLAGYGIIANTNSNERFLIEANLIENLRGGDGIQFASSTYDTIIRANTIRNIQPAFGSHSDVLQIVAHNERVHIFDNRFLDSAHPVRIAPSQSGAQIVDIAIMNNLIGGIRNAAIQVKSSAGVSGTLEYNTFTDYDLPPNVQSTLVVVRNVFDGPYEGGGDNYVGPVSAAPPGYGSTLT